MFAINLCGGVLIDCLRGYVIPVSRYNTLHRLERV